jgi:hypothetical protein
LLRGQESCPRIFLIAPCTNDCEIKFLTNNLCKKLTIELLGGIISVSEE